MFRFVSISLFDREKIVFSDQGKLFSFNIVNCVNNVNFMFKVLWKKDVTAKDEANIFIV